MSIRGAPAASAPGTAGLSESSLALLQHRRETSPGRRRGWLVRRALICADLLGLSAAFLLSELVYRPAPSQFNRLGVWSEFIVFLAALPLWVFAANLYGLYDRDEARTDHTTADDIVGLFHLVTIVAWVLVAGAYATRVASPAFVKVATFWLIAIPLLAFLRAGARSLCRVRLLHSLSEHGDCRRRPGRAAHRRRLSGTASTASSLSVSSTISPKSSFPVSRSSRSWGRPRSWGLSSASLT